MACLCFLTKLVEISIALVILTVGAVSLAFTLLRTRISKRKSAYISKEIVRKVQIGIFHPYCNAGGGGERVLWCAIRALQQKFGKKIHIKIYTGDVTLTNEKILQNAKNVFNIAVDASNIDFVFLFKRNWVEAERYPRFTLLGQSIGSMVFGLEALLKYQPDIFIDTMGYAFTYPIFHYLGRCKIASYTHYPIVSTDMLERVQSRVSAHNNEGFVARNAVLTYSKVMYYRLFALLYGWAGRFAQSVMVNSSWTQNHILQLWQIPSRTFRVYPPCEVSHLKRLQHTDTDEINILSIGQFRPEKDHPLQVHVMHELRKLLAENQTLWNKVKLVIIGSCRNEEDFARKKNIEDLAKQLSLEKSVEIRHNISYQELIHSYQTASIGLHTMWNEHFGIGVVECMAAGLITVANKSGGPLMDIVESSEDNQTGYLAIDAAEYAKCILDILNNTNEKNEAIRNAARSSSDRFSEEEFGVNFLQAVESFFDGN